ncbi:MliC family protein [Chelativorans sp. Marseille-P2723]|uniref:MliC family protein n=1 Tax=Chelativorans sp. Marseille-P2723 TaxID=2709133 RepID=UPI00156D760D|nr:MliC family protein [Chelativorans sp. Marseille-P2723]
MRVFAHSMVSGFALGAFMATADAQITIEWPQEGDIEVEEIHIGYDCGGKPLDVAYINAGPVSLAVLVYEDEPMVAANVIAASGARYASGRFIWWTKGGDAFLYDVTHGEDAAPIMECRRKN